MKKIIFKSLLFLLIISIGIFAGYENPQLVEIPKKNIKYFLKKIGLVESFIPKQQESTKEELNQKDSLELFANSFSLELKKIISLKGKTASIIFDENSNFKIFTQDGLELTKNEKKEINLPIDFTLENEGGVKSVFFVNNDYHALISRKTFGCHHASIIRLKDQKIILDSECIRDTKNVNFAGLGGGYVFKDDSLFLSIGTPTHISDDIDLYAQEEKSVFGKILKFKKDDQTIYETYSSGHRNPQGLTLAGNNLYSTEHGPQGGDELNKITQNKNYGWPIASLGTRYGGKSYKKSHSLNNFVEPIFSFLPAIAPSDLTTCPLNLKNYYKEYLCLIGLTLREMSIMIYLIDEKKNKLISFEKIPTDKRLRHFGLNKDGKLHLDKEKNIYISSDKDGVYKVKFNNFR